MIEIIRTPNPLNQQVILGPLAKAYMWERYKKEMLLEYLVSVSGNVIEYEDKIYNDVSKWEAETGEWRQQFESHVEELTKTHCGDCVYVATSCIKCWALDFLNLDLYPWLTTLHYIDGAFRGSDITPERALINLEERLLRSREKDLDGIKRSMHYLAEYNYRYCMNIDYNMSFDFDKGFVFDWPEYPV